MNKLPADGHEREMKKNKEEEEGEGQQTAASITCTAERRRRRRGRKEYSHHESGDKVKPRADGATPESNVLHIGVMKNNTD